MDDLTYICLEKPISRRKEIVRLTIDVIQILKKLEKLKQIRKEKEVYRSHFIKSFKELNFLFKDLDQLPQLEEKVIRTEEEITKKPSRKHIVAKKPEQIYLEKLDKDINELRAKLAIL